MIGEADPQDLTISLPDAEVALRIEAAVIDLLRLDNLTNIVRGSSSIEFGRVPLEELVFQYAAKPVDIEDDVLLIRINQQYRPGMSPKALYEATRGVWKLGPRRKKAKFAFAVFERVVREVYEIERWCEASQSTYRYETRDEDLRLPGKWEFEGRVALTVVRDKYFGRSVGEHLAKHSQNPIKYVNC